MSWGDRIEACGRFDADRFRSFQVDGLAIGLVRDTFVERLLTFRDVFIAAGSGVALAPDVADFTSRTAAISHVVERLVVDGDLRKRHGEAYAVAERFTDPPLFTMDRAAVPMFGVRAYGVHMNGFVRNGSDLAMWVGRRSLDKPVAPGKLDQMVAGGQPAGLTLAENLRKEAEEEAGLPTALVDTALPVGALTYKTEHPDGLRNDVLFIYDLLMPAEMEPVNKDGELTEFMLWPLEKVAALARDSDEFKFNSALVVADFLIRHGRIAPDATEYLDIIAGLHSA